MSWYSELKCRNVFKVAAVYAIVAWLLLQAADVVLPAFQMPMWTIAFVALVLAGFAGGHSRRARGGNRLRPCRSPLRGSVPVGYGP